MTDKITFTLTRNDVDVLILATRRLEQSQSWEWHENFNRRTFLSVMRKIRITAGLSARSKPFGR